MAADDDIREGTPKKSKKPVAPPIQEKRPAKKPRDEDDEAEEEKPRKKKAKVAEDEDDDDEDDDDETESADLGSSALSALMPVGGSVFALASLWIGFLSFVLGFVALGSSYEVITVWGIGKIPPIATCLMPMLWPVALLSGGLALLTHKHKKSYGSIAGNMRAIIGLLLSLGAMGMHVFLIYIFLKG